MKKLSFKQYLLIASLIFGMFFGAGNLIFPVHLTLGPLFATPRTATVSFSMFSSHFSKGMQPIALLIYSAIFFGLVYYFSLSEGKITERVGKMLNPAFLGLLFIIFFITLIYLVLALLGATSLHYFKLSANGGIAFAQDFHKRFPKISYRIFLTFNCGISFIIANFGLDTIISWSTPVLMFLYPLAIALILCGLSSKLFKNERQVDG